jgi:hypothetical protein
MMNLSKQLLDEYHYIYVTLNLQIFVGHIIVINLYKKEFVIYFFL